MSNRRDFLSNLNAITTFVFDVDGVFTNGDLLCAEDGSLLRTMNAKDGFAIQMILSKGYKLVIITGGDSIGVFKRMEKLGVKCIFDKARNKVKVLEGFLEENNISYDQVLYMGDDIPDYDAMNKCIVKCCPSDAVQEIKSIADYISPLAGGKGCVRDVVEKVLKVQGNWFIPDNK